MAIKKRVKKSSKKNIPKKRIIKKLSFKDKFFSPKDKTTLVFNNLIFFASISLVSLIFLQFVEDVILINLFFILSLTLGFTAVAFLLVLLTLLIKKVLKK